MNAANVELWVDRTDPRALRIVEATMPSLAPGQVRFRIERFALTANTVTYAVTGAQLGYWDFFPTDSTFGRVPAMGWAEVVESAHEGVAVGGRYYGWFPLARMVDMTVTPTAEGLRDDGAHRMAHAPVYRAYSDTRLDPWYQPGNEAEDRQALLRGLFLTGFLADDFLADQDYFGAHRVLVVSASSKTAIGYAQRAAQRTALELVGLTSAGNHAFVAGLNCYDEVLCYADVGYLPTDAPTVAVDMAGNGQLLEAIHARLGNSLKHSMAIGRSHHDAPPRSGDWLGPRPQFFFAPTQVSKRVKDWGREAFQQRARDALWEFVAASERWLQIQRAQGADAARRIWLDTANGKVAPQLGQIVSMW